MSLGAHRSGTAPLRHRRAPLALAGVLVVACGGGQTRGHPLDRGWSDEDGSELAEFERAFDAPAELAERREAQRAVPAVVVGVAAPPVDGPDPIDPTLVGLSDGRDAPWELTHAMASPLFVAGRIVVGLGGGELFAVDGVSGEVVWTRPAEGRLRGAGDDGQTTIVSVESLSGARSIVLAVARDGSVRRQLDVPEVVGVPAVARDHAFLPWNGDRVVVFDLYEGREVARVLSSEPVGEARALDGRLYFGAGTRAVRLDESIVDARRGGGGVRDLRAPPLPEQPTWFALPAAPGEARGSRHDGVSLRAEPAAADGSGGHYALAYYRLVVGFDATTGALAWLTGATDDLLAMDAGRGVVAACDAGGAARWLDAATGELLSTRRLGRPLVSCAIRAGARRPDAEPAPCSLATTCQKPSRSTPLVAQLFAALIEADPRLLPLQLQLLDELVAIEGEEASAALASLSSRELVPEAVRRGAKARLRGRRSGLAALLAALDEQVARPRSPWTGGERSIGALADALAAGSVADAAHPLGAALRDPWLDDRDARDVARALATLATPAERGALLGFLGAHVCAGSRLSEEAAVFSSRALVRLGARQAVHRASRLPCVRPELRVRLEALPESALVPE